MTADITNNFKGSLVSAAAVSIIPLLVTMTAPYNALFIANKSQGYLTVTDASSGAPLGYIEPGASRSVSVPTACNIASSVAGTIDYTPFVDPATMSGAQMQAIFAQSTAGNTFASLATFNAGWAIGAGPACRAFLRGAWTPVVIPGTSGPFSSSTQGTYWQIDKLVFVQSYIAVVGATSPVGNLRLGGFPAPFAVDTAGATDVSFFSTGASIVSPKLLPVAGGSIANFRQGDGSAFGAINSALLGSTFELSVNLIYQTP